MTHLSVNINKIATLRNARGGNNPDLIQAARDIESFGADGITVHPRPDERHIRYDDVYELKKIVTTEFNIEGNPREQKFIDLVLENKPDQVTLVPDTLGQLTSDHGWNTIENKDYLIETIAIFKNAGIRVSIFVDPDVAMVKGAKETGTDRIELYTESFAREFANGNKETSIDHLLHSDYNDFIVQEKMIQHSSFSKLYPNSINTIRAITYIANEKVYNADLCLRMGTGGAKVDNIHAGGIGIGISDNGTLNRNAYKLGYSDSKITFENHPDTNIVFNGYKIVGIDEIIETAKELHGLTPHIGINSSISFINSTF